MSLKDLLLAVRTLFRSPVFTLSVMLTLAIGVGATTAIFSVANAVLLKPLPYQDPDELVVLYTDMRARNSRGTPFSNENFVDIREGTAAVFDAMTAVQTVRQVSRPPTASPRRRSNHRAPDPAARRVSPASPRRSRRRRPRHPRTP
jgi:putative ABC transport system permease protein